MFGSVDTFLIFLFLRTISGQPQPSKSELSKFDLRPPATNLNNVGRQEGSPIQRLSLQDGENVQKLVPKLNLYHPMDNHYSEDENLGPEGPALTGNKKNKIDKGTAPSQQVRKVQEMTSQLWPMAVIPFFINKDIYDPTTVKRIGKAMSTIESVSCVVFRELKNMPRDTTDGWLHITNPNNERECVHEFSIVNSGTEVVLGFDCLHLDEIVHSLLHALGFRDEVTHPHRDLYIRVLWENIQPKYRELFKIRHEDASYKLVEYDPMSIMHFHDRAFSDNGAATIAAVVPGLQITSTNTLSQLDIMRLKLAFSHECNKRNIGDLLITCKNSLTPQKPIDSLSQEQENESGQQQIDEGFGSENRQFSEQQQQEDTQNFDENGQFSGQQQQEHTGQEAGDGYEDTQNYQDYEQNSGQQQENNGQEAEHSYQDTQNNQEYEQNSGQQQQDYSGQEAGQNYQDTQNSDDNGQFSEQQKDNGSDVQKVPFSFSFKKPPGHRG